MVKRDWESWGFLQQLFVATFPSFTPSLLPSTMSPSSVKDDGIKGIDTNALSHLGPNVGKPVRRYRFTSLLILTVWLTLTRHRYYDPIQRCADFFHELACRINPFLGHRLRSSPWREEIERRSILRKRISWSKRKLACP